MARIRCFQHDSRLDSKRNSNRFRFKSLEKLPSEEILYYRETMDPKRDWFHVERRSNCSLPKHRYQPYKRSSKERVRPIQIHFGSKKGQRWNRSRFLQNGISAENHEIPMQRNVGMQNRPKERLFSRSHQGGTSTPPRVHIRRRILPIYMSSIRSKHSSSKLYENNERNRKEMAAERNHGLYLHRRHPFSGKFVRFGTRKSPNVNNRLKIPWMASSRREISSDSNSNYSASGPPLRFRKWESSNSRRQESNSYGYHGQTNLSRISKISVKLKIRRQIHRKNGVPSISRTSNHAIPRQIKKANVQSGRNERMEWHNDDKSWSYERFMFPQRNLARFWNVVRTGISQSSNNQFRRNSLRIRHPFIKSCHCGSIPRRILYKRERIESNISILQRSKPTEVVSSRNSLRDPRRQSTILSLCKKRLWFNRTPLINSKRLVDHSQVERLAHFQNSVHSIRSKQHCRQTKQTGRLEIFSRIDKFGRRRIRSSHSRPVRKVRVSSDNHLQQLVGKRRILSTLGARLNQLLCPTSGINLSSPSSFDQIESKGNLLKISVKIQSVPRKLLMNHPRNYSTNSRITPFW